IEVGVALASGQTACFLVRPFPDWTHWNPDAEKLHGIARPLLLDRGRPAHEVANALNRLLGDSVAYSDAWGFDSSWMALLHAACDVPATYKIDTLTRLLSEPQQAAWAELKDNARIQLRLNRHRASADALVLQTAYLVSLR
ncbi:MAG: 3'-5' exonuclease, partial [Gammaproteobacteria bacterium]